VASWAKAKDPDAVLDYFFDWSEWLQDGELIETSTYIVAGSATLELFDETIDGGHTKFWARGGDAGDVAKVTNRVSTNQGRVDDDTATLRIKSR